MNQPINSKMYIAILESVPDYIVPTLVAHAVLSAHLKFTAQENNQDYQTWLQHSFRKVVLRVNPKEFDKISALNCHLAFESTILNGEMCCAVVYPLQADNTPNVLKFARMWKPAD
ncbi:hypothetical protein [Alysiella crassa]|uniref:Uncharacterized protein n=2 Tax=Alysiella crassa TaxID=153491 RepID=A0A376BLG5_9NEIS|nr:hypothetical protein [Alysiella crassa]SSY70602.1 Uncharacterised protein [Alysiella crassa]